MFVFVLFFEGKLTAKVEIDNFFLQHTMQMEKFVRQGLQATLKDKFITLEGMVTIPAGEFEMGSNDGDSDEKPVHRVYLDTYLIDMFEVTVAQYRQCVNIGRCQKFTTQYYNGKDQGRSKYCNWSSSARDDHPINCVDWSNAKAFCEHMGKRLPTEAEWEKAASWKDGQKFKYPSDKNDISCTNTVMDDGNKYGGSEADGCGKDSTWPLGSKPLEINGTHDMAGNVWEWVADWKGDYSSGLQRNPTGPSSGSYRVGRGGSWNNGSRSSFQGANRGIFDPSFRSNDLGFRCAASP